MLLQKYSSLEVVLKVGDKYAETPTDVRRVAAADGMRVAGGGRSWGRG